MASYSHAVSNSGLDSRDYMSNLVTGSGEQAKILSVQAISQDAVAADIRFTIQRNTGGTGPTGATPEGFNQLSPASYLTANSLYGANPTSSGNPYVVFGSSIHNTQIRSITRIWRAHPRGPIVVNESSQVGWTQRSAAGGYQSNSWTVVWADAERAPARPNRRRSRGSGRGFWSVHVFPRGVNAATTRPVIPWAEQSFVAYATEDFLVARVRPDYLAAIRESEAGGGTSVSVLALPVWARSQGVTILAVTGSSILARPVWDRSEAAPARGAVGSSHFALPVWSRSQAVAHTTTLGSSILATPVWSRSQALPTLTVTESVLGAGTVWSRSEAAPSQAGIGSQISVVPVWSRSQALPHSVTTTAVIATTPTWSRSESPTFLVTTGSTIAARPVWDRSESPATLAATGAGVLATSVWSRSEAVVHYVNTPAGADVTVFAGTTWSRSVATVTFGAPEGTGTTRAVLYTGH